MSSLAIAITALNRITTLGVCILCAVILGSCAEPGAVRDSGNSRGQTPQPSVVTPQDQQGSAKPTEERIFIGGGGIRGNYYAAAGAICELVNRRRRELGIRCSAESTGGSLTNLNAIRVGELDMGMAHSVRQYHAYKGLSRFFQYEGPDKELRTMFSVHGEPLTVVARRDAGIDSFDDLKGKRVNIGKPGPSDRITMEMLMAAKGWARWDFAIATEIKPSEQVKALCANEIDAFVYNVGHPAGSIMEATRNCGAVLIPVTGKEVDKLVAEISYFAHAIIPGGAYPGNPKDVRTFGATATLVSSTRVSNRVAYEVVKAVFENFGDFRRKHPAFAKLKKKDMVRAGNTAPIHEGAVIYYKEVGIL